MPQPATAFWLAVCMILYTYAGYPFVLWLLAKARRRRPPSPAAELPKVSIVLPVHNEAAYITAKIENTLALDYPRSKLELLVICDGPTDDTRQLASAYEDGETVRILTYPHCGKMQMLNEGAREANGSILVFSDASALLNPEALRMLVRGYTDSQVGGISGAYFLADRSISIAAIYWRYEAFVRRHESAVGGLCRFHGSLYSVRKALYDFPTSETINDDDVIALRVLRRGFRTLYVPGAVAIEHECESRTGFVRQVRTMAGTLQTLREFPGLIWPVRVAPVFCFLSHSLLRLFVPIFCASALGANLLLLPDPVYVTTLLVQVGFLASAALGKLGCPGMIPRASLYFCERHAAIPVALYYALAGFRRIQWR